MSHHPVPVDPTRFGQILDGAVSASTRARVIRATLNAAQPGISKALRETVATSPGVSATAAVGRSALWAEARFPDMVTALNDESARVLQTVIQKGLDEGLGADALGDRIEQQFTDWRRAGTRTVVRDGVRITVDTQSRAEMVARTETGDAFNQGTLDGYESAGVRNVDVFDGTDDPECGAANGSVWTVEFARDHKLEHPNCTRGFGPVIA